MSCTRSLSEPEKKVVAARQQWRCSNCRNILPAAYQVDHTVALCDGGADDISNCTAMCANCHAEKTQHEWIKRSKKSISKQIQYEDREDIFIKNGTKVKCSKCGRIRHENAPHSFCLGIESPNAQSVALTQALSRFSFVPRFSAQ